MIVVTGAYGFIESYLVGRLNAAGWANDLVIVDDFSRADKQANLLGKIWETPNRKRCFIQWFVANAKDIKFVYHLGARTDTTETNEAFLKKLNLQYSKYIWQICSENQIPLVYASSAATYETESMVLEMRKTTLPSFTLLTLWLEQTEF